MPLIVHVLDQLSVGGMESVALSVIIHTRSRYRHHVVCLREPGVLAPRFQAVGAQVSAIGKRPGKDIAAYWRLQRLLKRLRPNILHTYNIGALDVAFWARLAGVRRIVHAEHGRDAADPDGRNIRYRWLRRLLSPAIAAFVPVSADLSRWLIEDVGIPRDKVHLIRNGIDTQRFRPRSQSDACTIGESKEKPIVIGSVGRLDAVKDFDTLIDAFALLCECCPKHDLRLMIVGGGPRQSVLEKRVQSHGLSERVTLAGERHDVDEILRTLDIYVCSSIAEGVALTVLEAMATSLPVVATQVGGNPELVQPDDTGALVPSAQPVMMSEALQQLVDDPIMARRWGYAGRERVCRYFSIQAMVEGYCGLYDDLLGAGTVPRPHQERS